MGLNFLMNVTETDAELPMKNKTKHSEDTLLVNPCLPWEYEWTHTHNKG